MMKIPFNEADYKAMLLFCRARRMNFKHLAARGLALLLFKK